MEQRHYSSEGIIIARKNYSEADRIIVVVTKNHGKKRLVVKGVRLPKSRKRGSLEIFSLIKFSAVKGHGLDIMTEVETVQNFGIIRKDLKKTSVAYFFAEVTDKLLKEEVKSSETFELLNFYMNELTVSVSLRKLRSDFVYKILIQFGFWPDKRLLADPDHFLEEVLETKLRTPTIGRKVLS